MSSIAEHPERSALSPGGVAAFVVTRRPDDQEGTGAAGIWLGDLDGTPQRVHEAVPHTNLAFSPDGAVLAAGVQDSKGSQLLFGHVAGGSVTHWTEVHVPTFVEWVGWEGAELVVLAADPGADAASLTSGRPLPEAEQDPIVASRQEGWRRLWRVDPAAGTTEASSPEGLAVWEAALIPGGGAVVIASTDPTEAGWYRSYLVLLEADGTAVRTLHRSNWQLSSPAVDPAGERVAFVEGWASDRGLLAGEVRVVSLDGTGPAGHADPQIDVTWLSWPQTGRLWVAGWHHLGTAWGWVELGNPTEPSEAGPPPTITVERASCINSRWHPEIVPLPDDSVLTTRSAPDSPPEVVRIRPGAAPAAWTAFNADLVESRRLHVEELLWTSSDGATIEGLLVTPDDGDGPFPLVVDIHGGPSLAWHHSWDLPWAEKLTAAGYSVLLANPRGSAGRGQAFARANLGDPAGAEFTDLLAGVSHCVGAGLVDEDRVGAIGSSYGGYLTAWAVATSGGTFRTGVVIAGMSDLASCWGTANNAPFYDYLLGGRPFDIPVLYADRSPLTALSSGSAPALILHGELDRCVPVGQASELHAGLAALGHEVELVVYPREGHQPTEPAHIADQRARVVAWFDRHLAPLDRV
jgi:dipeptidyl aminopeptidase/acylaminoacyl peptidase